MQHTGRRMPQSIAEVQKMGAGILFPRGHPKIYLQCNKISRRSVAINPHQPPSRRFSTIQPRPHRPLSDIIKEPTPAPRYATTTCRFANGGCDYHSGDAIHRAQDCPIEERSDEGGRRAAESQLGLTRRNSAT